MPTKVDYKVFVPLGGEADPNAVEQLENCLEHDSAVGGALMADHHKGYSCPVGGVVAYDGYISPSAVGYDIACGNKAVRTSLKFDPHMDYKPIMRQIQKNISFGVGRANATPIEHELFDSDIWADKYVGPLRQKAHSQLGTVGSGNHYVDLLVDQEDFIWIANHFGSRGLGHTIATMAMNLALGNEYNAKLTETDDPILINLDTDLGQWYKTVMQFAGDYAYAGRDYVIDQVLAILENPLVKIEVHNHHNFAWEEGGVWVHRKGATPLTQGLSFIGGSMGEGGVIVRGKIAGGRSLRWTRIEDIGAWNSAPHGAGRVMSRTAAAGKIRKMWVCNTRSCDWSVRAAPGNVRKSFDGKEVDKCPSCGNNKLKKIRTRDKTDARVDWDAERRKLNDENIVVLGAGADEAPTVYKSLQDVLGAHDNVEILYKLRPIGVVMAGPDERDPYKD